MMTRTPSFVAPAMSLLVACVSACATPMAPPDVPDALRIPADQALTVEAFATGVQIYECAAAANDSTRFEWTFKAPEASLADVAGRTIGKHYAGPTWESIDGSKVVGEVKARDNGPDPDAIPWLLLAAKSTSGDGVFGRTASIQRIKTVGGKAPAAACNRDNAGQVARVPYRAVYEFYTRLTR